jgi:FkbM family methyltransferase
VREALRNRGPDTEERAVKSVLAHTGAEVVLDVGANVGQFAELVLRTGFRGKILSFEAVPSVHRLLVERARGRSDQWSVAPCAALGSERGKIALNVSANTVSSSILPMKVMHIDAAPESRYVDREIVDIERLDELAPRLLPPEGKLLIKVDTQGYEKEVLKGATALLHRTIAIQLELSLVPLYEGAPSFTEMISFVQSHGYDLFGIVPGFQDERTGRLLQVDGLFIRADFSSGLAEGSVACISAN